MCVTSLDCIIDVGQPAAPVGFLAELVGFCRYLAAHGEAPGGLVAEADVLGDDAQIDPGFGCGGWVL